VLVHEYGPHIYHTADQRVHDFLSRFTEWNGYQHEVLASIRGSYVPVPFNLNSIEASFEPKRAAAYIEALTRAYPPGSRVGILDLKEHPDPLLRELADHVYQNVFLHYTMKQWGYTPEQIDPAVTARVPVLVSRDNRYFQDPHQGLPSRGYTALFEALLDHPNIDLSLGLDAAELLELRFAAEADAVLAIDVAGQPYGGWLVYTGALDELAGWRHGLLPYRSLRFVYRQHPVRRVQPAGTVNFTVSEDYTRTTEYSWLTGQDIDVTTIAEEYPEPFDDPATQTPYYPVGTPEAAAAHRRYLDLFAALPRFAALGRLAEYRYYNIDQIVARALELADDILS